MRKRILILLVFAIFLSLSAVDFVQARAEEETSPVTISVAGGYEQYFNRDELVFNAEYSVFGSAGALTFTASNISNAYTYVWQTKDGTPITQTATLRLIKELNAETATNITNENLSLNLILVGTMQYRLVATHIKNNTTITKNLTVTITQNSEKYNISTYCPFPSSSALTKVTDRFKMYAFLPTTKAYSITWYLKMPNGVSYEVLARNVNILEVNPSELINDENGYGAYKIYVVATEKSTTGKSFASEVYTFSAISSDVTIEGNSYKIVAKEVRNSKTKIQAFEYSITETKDGVASVSALDPNRILWYVRFELVTRGRTFTYEPTTTAVYHVSVKYIDNDGNLIQLASHRAEPKSTGTGVLLLVIIPVALALVGIFAISVVIINKKRDVLW